MRLKKSFFSLMAIILALSTCPSAFAEAFTIPAGSTTSCKKTDSPIKDWWPANGAYSNNAYYSGLDMAALNGQLWILKRDGAAKLMNITVVDGSTFSKVADANLTGVPTDGNDVFYGNLVQIRRFGDKIIGINAPGSYWCNTYFYVWDNATSAPKITKFSTNSWGSSKRVSLGHSLGVYGDMSNGKIYVLSQDKTRVAVFTVSNNTINTDATVITLTNPDINSSDYAYIEPQSDGSFWVIQQATYGIHYNADGSQRESFNKNGFPSQYGTGQRHFTFKGRKLALAMNFGAASTGATLVSPTLALLDYTSGVGSQTNILKDAVTVSSQNQKEIVCTACDYEIKSADKHLVLYGLDCDGGIIRVEYDEASNLPAVVSNFKATAKWDGATQKVDLTWDAADKATSYRVYDYTDGESSEKKVYEGSDNNCTLDLAIGTGKQHKYRIIGVNSNGTSKNSAYANTYDAGFGSIALTGVIDPTDATATAKLEWNAPTGGTLKDYTIVKSIKKTGNDGSVVNSEEDYATVPAGTTKYEYANFKSLSSETEGNVTYSIATSLFVRANMEQTITTKDGNRNYVKSNTVTPVAPSAPYFTSVTTYKGRRTVALSWEVASVSNLTYYELYRDGIKILSSYNSGSYIDIDLPDGTYSYVVVAYWDNGTEKSATRSTPVTATIKYSSDVSTYILDEVYNYPIMTEAEWEAAGKPDDAVVAKGKFANGRTAVGSFGAPGDVYRQAQYYGGRWYIQQLTARTELSNSGNYLPNNYWDIPSGMTAAQGYAKYRSDWNGGIKSIGADAATIKTIGDNLKDEITTWGLECQFVAVDEEGNKWRRAIHSGPFSAYDTGYTGADNGDGYGSTNSLFYRPTIFVHGNVGETKITYNGKTFYELARDSQYGDNNQYYRTHYISAGGKYSQGTAFLLFSMNRSADVYRVCMNNNNTIKSVDLFTAPISEATAAGATSSDPTASTENYSFPVAGRNAFIQTVRGIGTWYVDGNTKKYSLMYSNTADITQCGGVTFTFNNEMFILHPSTIRSNNPGYFRIDMVQRKAGETAENVVPSRDNLIPTVANKLDEATQFTAGNSNASWYGAEYDATDDCIYIYQYVPGVRFAKYRLYVREQYPDVPPTLDITTGYNEDHTDITRFDSKITWQRPGTAHDYGLSENADIVVDHYEVTLKDNQGNALKTWNNVADVKEASHVFALEYNKTDAGVYNLDSEKYTAEIVPIYRRKNGTIIRGASNFAVDNNDYPAAIGEVNAWIYKGTQNGYRVDLDFDRAGAAASTEPVSYFLVEVSTDGGNTFSTLANFNLIKNGEDYHYYPVNVTNGQISGQYKFGTDYPGDTPSEKGYALREKANYATDHKCVLYYYTNTDPSDYKYRVTAVYAATNRAISKTASNIATNNVGGTSGIDDVNAYSLGAYPIPATTEITVTSPEAIRDIRIFSVAGAEVVRAAGEDTYTQKVDVSNLAAGVYMLVVNEQAPIRIVKK